MLQLIDQFLVNPALFTFLDNYINLKIFLNIFDSENKSDFWSFILKKNYITKNFFLDFLEIVEFDVSFSSSEWSFFFLNNNLEVLESDNSNFVLNLFETTYFNNFFYNYDIYSFFFYNYFFFLEQINNSFQNLLYNNFNFINFFNNFFYNKITLSNFTVINEIYSSFFDLLPAFDPEINYGLGWDEEDFDCYLQDTFLFIDWNALNRLQEFFLFSSYYILIDSKFNIIYFSFSNYWIESILFFFIFGLFFFLPNPFLKKNLIFFYFFKKLTETLWLNLNNIAGNKGYLFFFYSFFIFFFILGNNFLGMIPYNVTITSHIMFTFALAFFFFFFIVNFGFILKDLWFFELVIPKNVDKVLVPFLFIIELISFIIRPFSLAIRLFANILAGHALLFILLFFCFFLKTILINNIAFKILAIIPYTITVIIIFLEFLVCLLQAYVFAVLITIYFKDLTSFINLRSRERFVYKFLNNFILLIKTNFNTNKYIT